VFNAAGSSALVKAATSDRTQQSRQGAYEIRRY